MSERFIPCASCRDFPCSCAEPDPPEVIDQHDAERYARALASLLRRWCSECALDAAKRLVTILEETP